MVPRKQAGHMTCTRPQAARQILLATRASSTHDPERTFDRLDKRKSVYPPVASSSHSWLLPWFDLDRAQQRSGRDHHQDASETERDLHWKCIRDVDQRYVSGQSQQNATATNSQSVRT